MLVLIKYIENITIFLPVHIRHN